MHYYLSKICYLCLKDNQNLIVINKSDKNEILQQITGVLPEFLTILEEHNTTYICSGCHKRICSFYTFKKKSLDNVCRLEHYVNTLKGSSTSPDLKLSEIQITINNNDQLIHQETKITPRIKENIKNPSLSLEQQKNQISFEEFSNNDVKEDDVITISEDGEDWDFYQQFVECELGSNNEDDIDESVPIEILSDNEISLSGFEQQEDYDQSIPSAAIEKQLYQEDNYGETNDIEEIIDIDLSSEKNLSEKFYLNTFQENYSRKEKEFQCSICHKKLPSELNLKNHMEIHPGNFECSVCGQKFVLSADLKRHGKKHQEIKCTICNKILPNIYSYYSHKRIHQTYKRVECCVCNKMFATKQSLKNHMNIHLGIKYIECIICNKVFRTKDGLNYHMKSHLNIKDIKCVVCGEMFRSPQALRHHMKGHLDIECTVCNNLFKSSTFEELAFHIKDHKPIDATKNGSSMSWGELWGAGVL